MIRLLEGNGVGEEEYIQAVSLERLRQSSVFRRQVDIRVSKDMKEERRI